MEDVSIIHWYLFSSIVLHTCNFSYKSSSTKTKGEKQYVYVIGAPTATTKALQKYLISGKLPGGKAFRR